MPLLPALTSIRAVAALYVGAYHMVRPFSLWGPLAAFMSAGYAGVSFFFLLSGFILTYTHGVEFAAGKGNASRFWLARLARVYPLYLLVLVWAIYVQRYQLLHPRYHTIAAIADVLMVQSWSVRMVVLFNIPAWSLSVEAFFYFVFPFLAGRIQPKNLRTGLMLFAGCWLLAMLPPLAAMIFTPAAAWTEYSTDGRAHAFAFAMRRYPILLVPQFMAGIALGWIYLQRPFSRAFSSFAVWTGGVGAFVVLCWSDRLPYTALHDGLLIPLYALLILGLCGQNIVSKLLSLKPLVLLGEASYAFYLVHFVFNDVVKFQYGWPETIAALLPRLLVLVPLSILLHLGVERPGRRLVLRWWKAHEA